MPERAEAFDRPSVLHRSNGIDALNDFLKQTVRTLQGEWTSVVLGPTSLTAIPCRPDVTRKRDSTVVETLCLHLGQLSDRLRFLADNFLNGGVEMWRSGLGGEPPRLSRRPNFLRWVHGKSRQIFTRSSRASSAHGVRARAGLRIAVGSHEIDWFEYRLHSGNPSASRTTTLWLNP